MSGRGGSPRFGVNKNVHEEATDSNGASSFTTQNDGEVFTEVHYAYNPALAARPMDTTEGGKPGQYYQVVPRQADYMCNHDGYDGGQYHITNLDERKVVDNTIMAVKIECADDMQHIFGSDERTA